MTVCIASLFRWAYPNQADGRAILVASDRMLTAGDIEYEPPIWKIGILGPRVVVMVAGEITIHSEAVLKAQRQLGASPEADVGAVAEIYAAHVRQIRARMASQLYLAPLSLTEDSFLQRQSSMTQELVFELTRQLQGYRVNVEAIIAGCDDNAAHIYVVDVEGTVTCHDDVSFAAIGIGATHAKSHFMLARYAANWAAYPDALHITYSAKRRAEVAPGVGSDTDMIVITKEGWQLVPEELKESVREIYEGDENQRRDIAGAAVEKLRQKFVDLAKNSQPPSSQPDWPSPQETKDGPKPPPPLPG